MTDAAPVALPILSFVVLDANNVVTAAGYSNLLPAGATQVTSDTLAAVFGKVGACKWDGTTVSDYAPPPAPVPVPMAVPKLGLVRVLMGRGDWAKAKGLIAADPDTQDQWDAAATIAVADPLTQGLISAMGYDQPTVDAIMVAAVASA